MIRRAAAIRPDAAEYHTNLGNALQDAVHLVQAVEAHRRAIALKPARRRSRASICPSTDGTRRIDRRQNFRDRCVGAGSRLDRFRRVVRRAVLHS
jgi:hypothetical protein